MLDYAYSDSSKRVSLGLTTKHCIRLAAIGLMLTISLTGCSTAAEGNATQTAKESTPTPSALGSPLPTSPSSSREDRWVSVMGIDCAGTAPRECQQTYEKNVATTYGQDAPEAIRKAIDLQVSTYIGYSDPLEANWQTCMTAGCGSDSHDRAAVGSWHTDHFEEAFKSLALNSDDVSYSIYLGVPGDRITADTAPESATPYIPVTIADNASKKSLGTFKFWVQSTEAFRPKVCSVSLCESN